MTKTRGTTTTTGGENCQLDMDISSTASTIGSSINNININNEHQQQTRNNLNVTRTHSNGNGSGTKSNSVTHCRTHSHPLTLHDNGSVNFNSNNYYGESSYNGGGGGGQLHHNNNQFPVPASSTRLTEILNLDFVNIPPSSCANIIGATHCKSDSDSSSCGDEFESERCDPESVTLTLDLGHHNSSNSSNSSSSNNGGGGKGTPVEIPASVMKKYLITSLSNSSSGEDTSSIGVPTNSSNNNNNIEEILVDLGAVQSTSEIAKVLDNFNAILERIEREEEGEESSKFLVNSPSNSASGSSSRIKNSVEAFADLLLSGHGGGMEDQEDEDLLIIVDENDSSESLQEQGGGQQRQSDISLVEDQELEQDEINDLCPSLLELADEMEDYEGYESDRPMVRASMRKLRPVKLRPLPSNSCSTISNNVVEGQVAPPVTPRSRSPTPSASEIEGISSSSNNNNTIFVTSLVNSVLNSGDCCIDQRQMSSGGSVSVSIEGQGHSASDGPSQSHSRNQSASSSQLLSILVINESVANHSSNSSTTSIPIVNNNESHVSSGGGSGGNNNNAQTVVGVSSNNNGTSSTTEDAPRFTNLNSASSSSGPTTSTTTSQSSEPNSNSNATSTSSSTTTTSNSTTGTTATGSNGAARRTRGTGQNSSSTTTAGGSRSVPSGRWPHRLSSVLALIGCTLGLNNICRFSLLSVQYGANFILQFVFLSIVFGIPLLTFHMSIGQYLSSGIIDMWKISPIFQGIGVGLMISQAIIGLYTAVGVSWMFIYFRDSFVTRHDQYRWGKCVREFRECDPYQSTTVYGYNQTVELTETVPDYFNGVVLQRSSPEYPTSAYVPSSLKFTVAFNLAVVWMLVFVSLSKGLKSYGKVVHGFVLAPVAALFVLAFKMIGLVESGTMLFGQTNWSEFFFNSQTWVVAAREAFFTWGLLGACVMQVTAHNRHSHPLKSDSVIVILVTTVVLLLSAFIGNSCLSVITTSMPNTLQSQQYSYVPSSFESEKTYKFLAVKGLEIPELMSYNYNHNPFLMGVRIQKPDSKQDHTVSGYQVLRLATELFPTTMAILSPSGLSPFWTVLFYFTLVLFGIAQQLAIWHCVIKGIIAINVKLLRSWETTITFFICGLGFVLGLPLCTETGVFVNYFLDFAIGSGWWIMILYLLELVAVFIVRGAPYCGENIVTVLITGAGRFAAILAPLISFIWNVIMPVALLVLAIGSFKSGNIRELYDWNPHRGYIFWPSWTREVGSLIQLLPILAVPFVAIIQSCRYLSNGPADLFDRMQQLYRPNTRLGNAGSGGSSSESGSGRTGANSSRSEDPPPKYTPPPSYSTATGAKIARFLRNSFRRSIRRISSPGGPSTSSSISTENLPPPPNYASVILEINAQRANLNNDMSIGGGQSQPPPQYEEATQQQSAENKSELLGAEGGVGYNFDLVKKYTPTAKSLYQIQLSQTLGRSLGEGSKERASLRRIASDITSRDIARMLRASFRRPNESSYPSSQNNLPPYNSDISSDVESEGITFIANPPSNYYYNSEQAGPSCLRVPPYTFSRNSLEKIDYDLDMLTELEAASATAASSVISSSPPFSHSQQQLASSSSSNNFSPFSLGGFGFDRSRNRHSNDSQLALISNGCYDFPPVVDPQSEIVEIDTFTSSTTHHPEYHHHHHHTNSNLLTLGIVNPTFHLQSANGSGSFVPPHSEA